MSSLQSSDYDNDFYPLFTLMGVPWTANRSSILFVVPKFMICLVIAFIFHRDEPIINTVTIGLIYGILLNCSLFLHIIGHIFSSKFVSPAMTEARISPKLIETRYDNDSQSITSTVHIIRSIGGPLMNLFLGTLSLMVWFITNNNFAIFATLANFVFMVVVLLPLPSIDGEVIWREVFRSVRTK